MTDLDPNDLDRLHAQGWGTKKPSGYRVWLFLGVCVVIGVALVLWLS